MKPAVHALAALLGMFIVSACTSASSDKYRDPEASADSPIMMPAPENKIHGSVSMSVGTGRGYRGLGYPSPSADASIYPRAADGWSQPDRFGSPHFDIAP